MRGMQIFVKIGLKCSTYSPEHKTKRFRSINQRFRSVKVAIIFGTSLKLVIFFDKNSYNMIIRLNRFF
jgi:hypothetical protein